MRYGPFRDIDDKKISKMARSCNELPNYNIFYKVHPKNKIKIQFKYKNIVKKNLKDILNKYDFYILDYLSKNLKNMMVMLLINQLFLIKFRK